MTSISMWMNPDTQPHISCAAFMFWNIKMRPDNSKSRFYILPYWRSKYENNMGNPCLLMVYCFLSAISCAWSDLRLSQLKTCWYELTSLHLSVKLLLPFCHSPPPPIPTICHVVVFSVWSFSVVEWECRSCMYICISCMLFMYICLRYAADLHIVTHDYSCANVDNTQLTWHDDAGLIPTRCWQASVGPVSSQHQMFGKGKEFHASSKSVMLLL